MVVMRVWMVRAMRLGLGSCKTGQPTAIAPCLVSLVHARVDICSGGLHLGRGGTRACDLCAVWWTARAYSPAL